MHLGQAVETQNDVVPVRVLGSRMHLANRHPGFNLYVSDQKLCTR